MGKKKSGLKKNGINKILKKQMKMKSKKDQKKKNKVKNEKILAKCKEGMSNINQVALKQSMSSSTKQKKELKLNQKDQNFVGKMEVDDLSAVLTKSM